MDSDHEPYFAGLDDAVLNAMQRMAARYYSHGMYADSVCLLEIVARHKTNRAEVYFELGKARHAQSAFGAAIENYTRAVTLGLPNIDVYLYMGQCYIFLQMLDQAGAVLRQFLSLARAEDSRPSSSKLERAKHLLDDLVTPRLQQRAETRK